MPNQFIATKKLFKSTISKILDETKNYELAEAAFPAYANKNPFIDHLFWQRLKIPYNYLTAKKAKFNILDFGFGSGVMSYMLSQDGHTVTGLDKELSPHEMVKKYISFNANCHLMESNDKTIAQLSEGSFDYIIALDVLEHVDDLEDTIKFFRKLLKQGGEVIVSGPTENIFYKIGRKFAGKEYTGEYHVTDIGKIKSEFEKFGKVETLSKLYPPITLFEVFRTVN